MDAIVSIGENVQINDLGLLNLHLCILKSVCGLVKT